MSSPIPPPNTHPGSPPTEPQRQLERPALVIVSMCAAVVLAIAGVAGLTVAIPSIGSELAASQTELQWILDAFALSLAALLLPMGAMGDRFGRRRLMLAGLVVFVVASLWAASADSVPWLIAARAVGGVGAAMFFPGTLATLTATMPDERRATAIGLWAASASLGGTIGSLASGALVETWWFGSVFAVTAVAGTVVAAMLWRFVPETNDADHANLDPVGAMLSIIGIGGLILGIIEGPVKGWSDRITVAGFAAAAVGLIGFTMWELRTRRPLLDVRLFGRRGFATGSVSIFVQYIAVFGFFFVAAQYLAFVRGYGPFTTAAALLPVGVLLPYMSTQSARWARTHGRGRIGAAGLAAMATGCFGFAALDQDTNYWWFASALVVFGAGMGLAAPPATEAIVEALPAAQQGVASATNDVSRELGGAVGIAVIGSALTNSYRNQVDSDLDDLPVEVADIVRESAAAGLQVATGPDAASIIESIQAAVTDGFSNSMLLAGAILTLATTYTLLRAPAR